MDIKVEIWEKKQDFCREILLQGSDVQIVTGFALLLSAIIQYRGLSFYHLHIVYDTVSLVAVTCCAAANSSFTRDTKHTTLRYGTMIVWEIFFLVYVILFGIKLKSWNYMVEGHCYSTEKLARPQDPHPKFDNVYIAVTSLYLFTTWYWCLVGERPPADQNTGRGQPKGETYFVLFIAMFQFPLHTYSVFSLRASNEKLLKSGNTEQQWGFGQIAAILLLGGNLVVLMKGIQEWKSEERRRDEEAANGLELDDNVLN